MNTDYSTLRQKALVVKDLYAKKQVEQGKAVWTASDYMAGFVADVGTLSEIVMAKKGVRTVENADQKLEHELSDCLYSVIVLADEFGIDLPQAFNKNMDALAARIDNQANSN